MYKLKRTINTSKYVKTHKQQNINQIKSMSNNIYNKQIKHLCKFLNIKTCCEIEEELCDLFNITKTNNLLSRLMEKYVKIKNNLKLIKYLHKIIKVTCKFHVINWASKHGYLEVIKYLHKKCKELVQ